MKKLLSTTLLLVLLPVYAISQTVDYYKSFAENAGENSVLYRGRAPVPYHFNFEGTQYVFDEIFRKGEVQYNGKRYYDVEMNLNCHLDELIIKIPGTISTVILNKNFVKSFQFDGKSFVYYKNDIKDSPEEGYYQLLHAGKDTLLRMVKKRYVEEIPRHATSGSLLRMFNTDVTYHLYSAGKWYVVKNRRDVLKVYPAERRIISRFIRESRLNFITDRENSIVQVVKFADQNKQSVR
jgi:hypothetical protein